jgi:adenosylhomocysteine nucleosidase
MGRGVVALMCAVSAEERMLRRFAGPGVRIVVTGMGAAAAERLAAEAIGAGATAAISVGFCGALDHSLARGDVVVPEEVCDGATGEAWPCDVALARGAGRMHGTLVTAHQVVSDPGARGQFNGIAVDMESAGTARACTRAGIPFAVIRAVTDRAGDRVPDIAGVVDDEGGVHPLAALRRIAAHPSDIPAWMGLARGARAARRGLVPAVAAALAGAA